MRLKLAVSIAVVATAMSVSSMAGTLKSLVHQPPDGAVITMQLTDGTVMAQGYGQSDWWKLTPDNTCSYINGTWKPATPPMPMLKPCWPTDVSSLRAANTMAGTSHSPTEA